MLRARRRAALTDRNHRLEIRVQGCNDIEVGGFMVLNLVAPPRLISISALNRLFSAGASISATIDSEGQIGLVSKKALDVGERGVFQLD